MVGFKGNDVIAIADLGETKIIKKISAGFLQQQGAWIFLPSEVSFLFQKMEIFGIQSE